MFRLETEQLFGARACAPEQTLCEFVVIVQCSCSVSEAAAVMVLNWAQSRPPVGLMAGSVGVLLLWYRFVAYTTVAL